MIYKPVRPVNLVTSYNIKMLLIYVFLMILFFLLQQNSISILANPIVNGSDIFSHSFFYLFFVQIWCIVSTETINKHELSCLSYMIIWFILVDNPKYIDHFYSDVRIINFGCRFFVEIFGCFVSFHDHIIMTLRIYLILHQCLISTKDNNPNIISWYWLLYLRK